jgi:hypothetical protein
MPESCNRASMASSGSVGASVAFFARAIRSFLRSLLRIRKRTQQRGRWRRRRHRRCRDLRSADSAIATGNTVEVGGIDDPKTATLRLLMNCNLAHPMADVHLAGRDRHRHALPDQPHGAIVADDAGQRDHVVANGGDLLDQVLAGRARGGT